MYQIIIIDHQTFSTKSVKFSNKFPNFRDFPPLSAAIKKDNFSTVKFLLSQPKINANIDFKEINIDMKEADYDKISDLFQSQKGKIRNKITTLYSSIMSNDIDIVKLLLGNPNVDVNKISALTVSNNKKPKGLILTRAPLHLAVDNKNIEIIQLLLKQKEIKINILDENDKKPIDHTDDEKIKNLFKKE